MTRIVCLVLEKSSVAATQREKREAQMALTAQQVVEALRPIQDPDLHRSIVELGFIKNLEVEGHRIGFDLELTTPACPVKDQLREACVEAIKRLDQSAEVEVKVTAQTRGPGLPKGQGLEGVGMPGQVQHRQIFGEADGMIERQQADVGAEPHSVRDRGHGPRHRGPAGQIAVIDEVVLGEPHQIGADLIQPANLLEHFRV